MKRIMLAVFVICGALSLSGCILPPGDAANLLI